jgi:hypothetical protein
MIDPQGQKHAGDAIRIPMFGRRPLPISGEKLLALEESEAGTTLSLDVYLTEGEEPFVVLSRRDGEALPLALFACAVTDHEDARMQLGAVDITASEPLDPALLTEAPLPAVIAAHAELTTRIDRSRRMIDAMSTIAFGAHAIRS